MSEQATDTADYSDQTGFFDPDTFNETVTVVGCGGIGASLLPTLVTMGVKQITLYDPDIVEKRNLASQTIYRPADIGRLKVERCAEYIQKYDPNTKVTAHARLFTADEVIEPTVLIGAVDSMTARKIIWRAVKKNDVSVELMLDGRIGGEHMSLFAVDPMNGQWYEDKWLFSDEEASPLPCSRRTITYPAVILGGIMCRHLAHWHTQNEFPPNLVDFSTGDLFFQEVKCE